MMAELIIINVKYVLIVGSFIYIITRKVYLQIKINITQGSRREIFGQLKYC